MRKSLLLAVVVCCCTACRDRSTSSGAVQAGRSATATATATFDAAAWRPPSESELPPVGDSMGVSIRRGLAIITHTPDSLPAYAPGHISCTNCHMNGGRSTESATLAGSHARFPKYLERAGAVITLADRVNYCFTRSLAGSRLPVDSREMHDILSYLAWLSRGAPVGEGMKLAGASGLPPMPDLEGDTVRGKSVYAAKCASCHQPNGAGNVALTPAIPALWGAKSFSVGASMARRSKATSFIWHNMPLGLGKTLTQQEAADVAAYVTSQPRPDSPGKEHDWPMGGTPKDVPYATTAHAAYMPPRLLPRRNPQSALVPAPLPAARPR
ncbi:MAG TPA: c-type cytochrome [Gemmatimonadaceae bacterium]|nr:c-type cytochrome [Gemmatimonadaceae bacterium]